MATIRLTAPLATAASIGVLTLFANGSLANQPFADAALSSSAKAYEAQIKKALTLSAITGVVLACVAFATGGRCDPTQFTLTTTY